MYLVQMYVAKLELNMIKIQENVFKYLYQIVLFYNQTVLKVNAKHVLLMNKIIYTKQIIL